MDSDYFVFFFKQKTAYEMRISDWSSDVCSSDLSTSVAASPSRHSQSQAAKAPPRQANSAIRKTPVRLRNASTASEISSRIEATSISAALPAESPRSVELRVGTECVSTSRSRWSRYP